MNKHKILIDASQPEETRVVILDKNDSIGAYEFEVANKEELKGNIYLAKVNKVEASLQAAFMDYGHKKQGFLPFNEINFEYFSLTQEEIEKIRSMQKARKEQLKQRFLEKQQTTHKTEKEQNQKENINPNDATFDTVADIPDQESIEYDLMDDDNFVAELEKENLTYGSRFGYKIQDVIKPGQLLLVQVTKDERGTKGAALSTYISIPGRYAVFMPKMSFEGRISKKITSLSERQRLKSIIKRITSVENHNIIMRTASIGASEKEIVQDYNYLLTMWDIIQTQITKQKKPGILMKEGILIKKVIRDIYAGNVDQIIVEGKDAFNTISNFAQIISTEIYEKISEFKRSKSSLFKYFNVEEEVRNIYSPVVFLQSGSYIIIQNTEALVAIDVNSGKAKGRRNVEETALQTNLEATKEIAKQLKLRDIGGIIVIDFIDMENPKNRIIIERKMRELLKNDPAKMQVSTISNFGLLEISRQHLKASLIEKSFNVCPKCQGIGYVTPIELSALNILRNLELDIDQHRIKNLGDKIVIKMPSAEAFYILNNKRDYIIHLERALKKSIRVEFAENISYPFYLIEEEIEEVENESTALLLQQQIEQNLSKEQSKKIKPKRNEPHTAVHTRSTNKPVSSWWKKLISGDHA